MKRWLVLSLWLCFSASCFGDVTINNPYGVCLSVVQWLGCGCFPWYTCCVPYTSSHSPPCPGSVLEILPCDGSGPYYFGGSGPIDGGTINIPPTGPPTYSAPPTPGTQPVPNPGNTGILVGQTKNGALTGNYAFVPAGGTGSLPVTGSPGDDNQWGIIAMPAGTTIATGANGATQNPDGTINITGGTPTVPSDDSGFGLGNSDNPLGNNGLPPIIPDPPDWGTPGTTNYPAPVLTNGLPNVPPGYTIPNSGVGTNNPTGLPTTGAPATSNLNTGTFSQGINTLYTQDSLDTQAIIKAIQAADQANQAGHAGVSNGIQTGNNILKGISNHVSNIDNATQVLTNQGNFITNALGQIVSNTTPNTNINYDGDTGTGKANGATAAGASQLQALGDKFSIDPGLVGGSAGSFLITLPGQGSWDINPVSGAAMFPAVATAAPWVRKLSQWAMTAWFLFWLVGELNQAVRDTTHLPQGTSAETTLGVGTATAWVAAAVVFVAITAFITYIGSLVVNSLVTAFLAHPFDSGGGEVVQSGIALLDAVFDIGLCVSLMAQRLALSFYLSKAYLICAGVVRFAVG